MAQKNIGNMIVKHISNPKNWTKKKMAALGVAVASALVANQFAGKSNASGDKAAAKKGQTYAAKVIKVADGDTATVTDTHGAKHTLRFAYIDAPEKAQAHGIASKNALEKLIHGKQVEVYVTDVDRYSREVAVVKLQGLDVNYEQVKNGNAWHYQTYAKKSQPSGDYSRYAAALAAAEKNRVGLWSGKKPQAPWDYRAQLRAQGGNTEE
ncbi:thermonuclease family protein [Alysiella crassa]|nr:thermonuclease family protein [Alysiella crassa]UOP07571.1 thermonuclease family protein [Alysiella crassa]